MITLITTHRKYKLVNFVSENFFPEFTQVSVQAIPLLSSENGKGIKSNTQP